MKNLKVKVTLLAIIAFFSFWSPTESIAQPRQQQDQRYNQGQGYDDAYSQRRGYGPRGRMHRRYSPRRQCIAPPPPPIVRHRRMVHRMAHRHHCGWCATTPRPRYGHR
jgi:hypothetical protein